MKAFVVESAGATADWFQKPEVTEHHERPAFSASTGTILMAAHPSKFTNSIGKVGHYLPPV